MKLQKNLFAVILLISLILGTSSTIQARVMMSASISGFTMNILPVANFTVDDWYSNPNLWTITIINSADGKTVKRADVQIVITSGKYGTILDGTIRVVGPWTGHTFLTELPPGHPPVTINNTMMQDTNNVGGTEWSDKFEKEVLRIGFLPEGLYTMTFTLTGYYDDSKDRFDDEVDPISESFEIKNPLPPELITPVDNSVDVVTIPRFVWQRPQVTDLSSMNKTVEIYYTINVWRMFEPNGSVISEEDAINRIPIWTMSGLATEAIDFDPGSATEELINGRRYCWQVQGIDGTGRPISMQNEGKSDLWDFTVQFTPPVINEPTQFFPLQVNWSAAQAGGGTIYYRVRIADNIDFNNAYKEENLVMTSLICEPPFIRGNLYYIEVQATDEYGIAIGEPIVISFTVPSKNVFLRSPVNNSVLSTKTPVFAWTSGAFYFVVMIYEVDSDKVYRSSAIQGTTWIYDGEELSPGVTYTWNVSPADENGELVGKSSDRWRFTLSAHDQVTLIGPVNTSIDNIYPQFSWNEVQPPSDESAVNYTINIEDDGGATIHTATVSTTTFLYPQDAPQLSNTAKYLWNVTAEQDGQIIGNRSQNAYFITPISEAEAQAAMMEEITKMLKLILSQYPQFSGYENKILKSIADKMGVITPSQFKEYLNTYRIISVTEK